jgi:ubiquinone/menaquinone biosynthesis C-methylase UbiE
MANGPVLSSRNPFALPTGLAGRLAGWVMGRDDRPHQEAAELLAAPAGADICEIGFGPGQLLAVLAGRDPTVRLHGVDPSPVMLAQARRRLQAAHPGLAGTADLRLGAAGALPFADDSVDHVVAVNTVALWPDRPAALAEAHRVLRPGGTLLLAWHSAATPNPLRRALAKPDQWWSDLLDVVRREFGQAHRHELRHLTACTATG